MYLYFLACTEMGFWDRVNKSHYQNKHLLQICVSPLFELYHDASLDYVNYDPLVLRKLCSDVTKHNDKMPPFNIWHRTSIVKDFCRKEGDHVFWMKFLMNNLSYICSSFIYVFHDTKGHDITAPNLPLVECEAFIASSVHCMVRDLTIT